MEKALKICCTGRIEYAKEKLWGGAGFVGWQDGEEVTR